MRDGYQPSHLMELIMDHYTDMAVWEADAKAFLTKVGQVEEAKPTKSKKDEE